MATVYLSRAGTGHKYQYKVTKNGDFYTAMTRQGMTSNTSRQSNRTVFPGSQTVASALGLVGHWPLHDDEASTTVVDTIGSNDLTSERNVSLMTTTGRMGKAHNFNGTSDFHKKSVANFRSADSLGSISAWVKTSGAVNQTIFSSSDEGTDTSLFLFGSRGGGDTGLRFQTRNAGGTSNNTTGGINVIDNEWHHCVVTSDGSQWRMYVDAVEDEVSIIAGSNTGDWFADVTLRDSIVIGALVRTGDDTYQAGIMEDVAIFNTTLTQAQINLLYNSGNGIEMIGDAYQPIY